MWRLLVGLHGEAEVERREVAPAGGEEQEQEGAQHLAQRDRVERHGGGAAAPAPAPATTSASAPATAPAPAPASACAAVVDEGPEGAIPCEARGDEVEGDARTEEGEEERRYVVVEERDALHLLRVRARVRVRV